MPSLGLGFILAGETAEWLRRRGDAQAFAAQVIEAMPKAGLVHLIGPTILALDDEDISLVGAFQAKGWEVEAKVDGGSGSDEAGLWDVLRLVSLGVDRIVTDDSEGLLAALAGHRPPSSLKGRLPPKEWQADGGPPEAGQCFPEPRTAAWPCPPTSPARSATRVQPAPAARAVRLLENATGWLGLLMREFRRRASTAV